MRIAIDWIKSNVISVISIVIVLASLGFLIAVPQMKGKGALRKEIQDRTKKLDALAGYMNVNVPIPPAGPDAPEETILADAVNDVVIAKLQNLYTGLENQYNGVFQTAVQFNSKGHKPLLDGLFPSWNSSDIPYEALNAYLNAFGDSSYGDLGMFKAYDAENPDAPRLDARMPPSIEQLQAALDQLSHDYAGPGTVLTEADLRDRDHELQLKLIDMLRLRAEQIHIYTQTDMNTLTTGGGPSGEINAQSIPEVYPFQIQQWAFSPSPPQAYQLWEGQLELWIQQDIVRAIGKANHVEDPVVNVLTAPVKRLVRIEVVPGYIGLHTVGAAQNGNYNSIQQPYPNPIGGQRTNNPDEKVSDNFYVGPTGRVSNALYDVRQAVLTVVVDYKKLPELINAFSDVNFMTVLNVQVQDVDEYDSLHNGYIYGNADVVLARMVIETIWLRQWTESLMPERVRSYVGIDEPTVDAGPANMMGPDMMYEDYSQYQ